MAWSERQSGVWVGCSLVFCVRVLLWVFFMHKGECGQSSSNCLQTVSSLCELASLSCALVQLGVHIYVRMQLTERNTQWGEEGLVRVCLQ